MHPKLGYNLLKCKHKAGASGARGPEAGGSQAGQGDLAILGGEGEGSLPLHPPVANELIHYILHKLLSI